MKKDSVTQLLWDILLRKFIESSPEEWSDAPTIIAEIPVPLKVQRSLKKVSEIFDLNQVNLETGIFSALIIRGISEEYEERKEDILGLSEEELHDRLSTILEHRLRRRK